MKNFTSQTHSISIPSSSRSGPAGIFWDIEIHRAPHPTEAIPPNIVSALKSHPAGISCVTTFSAYGNFHSYCKNITKGLENAGVRIISIPKGKKPSVGTVILVDINHFTFQNPPPSTILLISRDATFAPHLHLLGQRGHTIMLVTPSPISPILRAASRYVWDWIAMTTAGRLVAYPSTVTGSGPPASLPVSDVSTPNQYPIDENEIDEFNVDDDEQNKIKRLIRLLKIDMLQILFWHEYPLEIGDFEKLYSKEHGKSLEYREFGVRGMEELVEKVKDVVKIEFDETGEKKYLIPSFLITFSRSNMKNLTSQTRSISIPSSSRSGPAGIFWDIENCEIPTNVSAELVSANILSALRSRPSNISSVTAFCAFGTSFLSPKAIKSLHLSAVRLVFICNKQKNAADGALITDMFQFANDNRPPCTIVLISGDGDFSWAVQLLVDEGYTVMLVVPSKSSSADLCAKSPYVWDWLEMASGKGLVPPPNYGTGSGPPVWPPVTDVSPSATDISTQNQFDDLRTLHDDENEIEELNADNDYEQNKIERLIRLFKIDVLQILCDTYSIEIGDFENSYSEVRGKSLEYHEFRVSGMEELVEKVKDVVKIVGDKRGGESI